jgi:hypothetical protein
MKKSGTYNPDITTAAPGKAKSQGGSSTGKEAQLQKRPATPMDSSKGPIAGQHVNK